MMVEMPTLYVCHGDDGGPRRHPCRRVQEALRAAGIEYEKVIAAHGHPIPFLRKGSRDELREATGDTKLPALKLPDGTIITHSRAILAGSRGKADSGGAGRRIDRLVHWQHNASHSRPYRVTAQGRHDRRLRRDRNGARTPVVTPSIVGRRYGKRTYNAPASQSVGGGSAWPENAGVCWCPEYGSRRRFWSSCADSSSSGCWRTARTWRTHRFRSASSIRTAGCSTPAGIYRRANRSSYTTG